MRTPRFDQGAHATHLSSGALVVVADLALPPFHGLGSTEPFYLVVLFVHVLDAAGKGFVVAESDLEPLPT
jgi:hypothetical protein